jgi:hypothetical protein
MLGFMRSSLGQYQCDSGASEDRALCEAPWRQTWEGTIGIVKIPRYLLYTAWYGMDPGSIDCSCAMPVGTCCLRPMDGRYLITSAPERDPSNTHLHGLYRPNPFIPGI